VTPQTICEFLGSDQDSLSDQDLMFAAVLSQLLVSAALCLIAWMWQGWDTASYLALGAVVVIVPNAIFALRLAMHQGRTPESYPVVFFLGEFLKIGLMVAGLGLIVKYVPGASWLPLLIGLIAALKAPFLSVFWGAKFEMYRKEFKG
jgi:ATP synthase protein I